MCTVASRSSTMVCGPWMVNDGLVKKAASPRAVTFACVCPSQTTRMDASAGATGADQHTQICRVSTRRKKDQEQQSKPEDSLRPFAAAVIPV